MGEEPFVRSITLLPLACGDLELNVYMSEGASEVVEEGVAGGGIWSAFWRLLRGDASAPQFVAELGF